MEHVREQDNQQSQSLARNQEEQLAPSSRDRNQLLQPFLLLLEELGAKYPLNRRAAPYLLEGRGYMQMAIL